MEARAPKPIRSEVGYEAALERLNEIFQAEQHTALGKRPWATSGMCSWTSSSSTISGTTRCLATRPHATRPRWSWKPPSSRSGTASWAARSARSTSGSSAPTV